MRLDSTLESFIGTYNYVCRYSLFVWFLMQALVEVQNNFKEREVILTNAECNIVFSLTLYQSMEEECALRGINSRNLRLLIYLNGGNNYTVWSPCM